MLNEKLIKDYFNKQYKPSPLEKKLKDLGYEYKDTIIPEGTFFRKQFSKWLFLEITTDLDKKKVCGHQVIQIVRHIIDTSQAFNEMEKDLEELKKYED